MGRKVERECPVCGVTYEADEVRLKHGRQTTCSRGCSYILRGQQKELGQVAECSVCGQQFTRTPSQIKSKHGAMYCSRACHYRGRSLGLTPRVVTEPYSISEEARVAWAAGAAKTAAIRRAKGNYSCSDATRARLRETTASAIAEGRIPAVSGVEDVVADCLTAAGVGFRRQHAIRGAHGRYVACVDFLLDDGSVLEVNGTFWHADPRVFPDGPVYPSQVRSAERWERKVAALSELRIPLRVCWEIDVEEDAAQAVAVALGAI